MRDQHESAQIRFFDRYSESSAVLAILAGLLALLSRQLGMEFIETASGAPFIKTASALCFTLLGVSLLSFKLSSKHSWISGMVARLFSYMVLAIALALLSEYLLHFRLTETLFSTSPRRLASLATAFNFAILSSAMLLSLSRSDRQVRNSQILAILAFWIAFLCLLSKILRSRLEPNSSFQPIMSVHSAILFILLSIGVFVARPRSGMLAILAHERGAGLIVQQMVPFGIILPLLLSWAWFTSAGSRLHEIELGIEGLLAIVVVGTCAIIWTNARSLIAAEKLIQKNEERYRSLFDNMNDGFVICEILYDENGVASDYRHLAANRAVEKHSGLSPQFLLQTTARQIDPSGTDDVIAKYDSVVKTGDPVYFQRYYETTSREYEFYAYRFAPGQFAVIFHDIGERKRALVEKQKLEAQLVQAQKMEAIGQLAGGVAHDFNNALMAISGYTELIQLQAGSEQAVRSYAEELAKATEQANHLTHQLLAFSRKQILLPKIIDINTILMKIEKMLRTLLGDSIEVTMVLAEDLGKAKLDPGQIQQVIINLAVNSRDAMPTGGKLLIETKNITLDEKYIGQTLKPGNYLLLTISDTGNGMDDATTARIFEPFFTTKGEGKGTGLGLSTVYGIVTQSGGDISVYSQLGVGTAFRIYLPRTDAVEEDLAAAPMPIVEHLGSGEKILLVDDNDSVRSATAAFLELKGYKVVTARNGEEAFGLMKDNGTQIDLIISDVIMPTMGGQTLARRMKDLDVNAQILFMSGYTEEAINRHGILDGGSAFISKPVHMLDLLRKVNELLEQKKSAL